MRFGLWSSCAWHIEGPWFMTLHCQIMVAYTFNSSTWESEAGGPLGWSPPLFIEQVPGQPRVQETLSWRGGEKNKSCEYFHTATLKIMLFFFHLL